MTKISSFLVFFFGIFLLVVSLYSLGSRFIKDRKEPLVEESLPTSTLTALRVNSIEDMHRQLDKVYEGEGLEGIRAFVAQEFTPGRTLILRSSYPGAPDREYLIVDREVRRCNRDGAALLDKPPVLTRVAVGTQAARRSVLQTWSRSEAPAPYYLTAWCLEMRVVR